MKNNQENKPKGKSIFIKIVAIFIAVGIFLTFLMPLLSIFQDI